MNSCDLPEEANADCNAINLGSAYIDECGRCVGGDTNSIENEDKDCCGKCFGDHDDCDIACDKCGNEKAINYDFCNFIDSCDIDECGECLNLFEHNEELCVYDLCTDYIESNNTFNCETNGSSPYDIGEVLGCETLETEFDICYPEDCGTIKLADFEDKIIFIIYEQDWWTSCFSGIPQLEENVILHYLDNPNIAIINVLSDIPGGLSCEIWGNEGNDKVPLIINDYDYNGLFGEWFNIAAWSSPWYFIIDENFVYQVKTQSESEAENLLEEMLTNLE